MNKPSIRTIACILLLCLSFPLFSACTRTESPETDTKSQPSPTAYLDLWEENGDFRYTFIRPDVDREEIVKQAAVLVRTAILTLSGAASSKIRIATDWTNDDTTTPAYAELFEVLIGATNRPESVRAQSELGPDEYIIRVDGNKIVITGYDDQITKVAARHFLTDVLQYDGTEPESPSPDLLRIPADLSVHGTYTAEERKQDERAAYLEKLESLRKDPGNAQIVQTLYPTDYPVVADILASDYDIDPTGVNDSTKGIQAALSAMSKLGGGTVFLPAGTYRINGTLTMPKYVTLQGDWQNPKEVRDGRSYGTVLMLYPKEQQTEEDALQKGVIRMGGRDGLRGLTLFFPEQNPTAPKIYPHAIYAERGGLSTIEHVTILNAYSGIGAALDGQNTCSQMTIRDVYGTYLHTGVALYNSADVGIVEKYEISPDFWSNCRLGTTYTRDQITAATRGGAIGMKMGDLEWTEFSSVSLSDLKYGLFIDDGFRISFAGSFYDLQVRDCDYGMYVKQLDQRWGMVITHATLEGSVYAVENTTTGYIKASDTTYLGQTKGIHITDCLDNTVTAPDTTGATDARHIVPKAQLYTASLLDTYEIDSSELLQDVLDKAGKTGGIVYVPAGTYLLDRPVTVPEGVELRGSNAIRTACDTDTDVGTTFYVTYGTGSEYHHNVDKAAITLSKNAGMSGIKVLFIRNDSAALAQDGCKSVYAVRGEGENVYVENCMIAGSGYGIDFRGCDNHYISGLMAWCYYNIIAAGGKNGVIKNSMANATVLYNTTAEPVRAWGGYANYIDSFAHSRTNLITISLMNAQGERISNVFTYGCMSLMDIADCTDVFLSNIGADNICSDDYLLSIFRSEVLAASLMRYNGLSISSAQTELTVLSRIAINEPDEPNLYP